MEIILTLIIVALLAYANGANDNFKGVATLMGSNTLPFKAALAYATITSFAGSLVAFTLASGLVKSFSGKGLVPTDVLSQPAFPLAVGLAAAITILLATRFGFPISTTHALIGGLIGAGIFASPTGINFATFGKSFVLPLLLSPFLALLLAGLLYPVTQIFKRKKSKIIEEEKCLCMVPGAYPSTCPSPVLAGYSAFGRMVAVPNLIIAPISECAAKFQQTGITTQIAASRLTRFTHLVSGGAVCFARAVNDTPKIAAILVTTQVLQGANGILMVGLFMGLGGLLSAKKVAETMSYKVSEMDETQGMSANLATSFLVLFASKLGVPVSTTHVSTGAIMGVGMLTKKAHWGSIRQILLAWGLTLPIAACLAPIVYFLLH